MQLVFTDGIVTGAVMMFGFAYRSIIQFKKQFNSSKNVAILKKQRIFIGSIFWALLSYVIFEYFGIIWYSSSSKWGFTIYLTDSIMLFIVESVMLIFIIYNDLGLQIKT